MSDTTNSNSPSITDSVKEGYGAVARAGLSSDQKGIANIAKAFGYSAEELSSIPAEANMGLSCGNPVATATLREGETVVDLGSGGGLDVFLAAQKVGASGRAIGIDMTEDMIKLAKANAEKAGHENVEFYLAEIPNMPLDDNSVDCIISNCVLNLVEDKDAAFREIFRVLKPGGRLAVSDIALRKPLPDAVANDVAGWTACISGAIAIDDNRQKLNDAGFSDVQILDSNADLNAYKEGGADGCCAPTTTPSASTPAASPATTSSSCCGPSPAAKPSPDDELSYHDHMAKLMDGVDFNEYAASVKMFAIKPV